MSRIGNQPINLPAGVEVKIDKDNLVTVKGPKGELQEKFTKLITIENKDGVITVSRDGDEAEKRSQHGMTRSVINNMIIGVTEGYEKRLELVGIGYKAEKKGKKLVLSIGFSHTVEMEDPAGITTEVPEATKITVKGIDKALVGDYAAQIRANKKPEPYKGKGIKYEGEYIRRKEGKAGVATAADV